MSDALLTLLLVVACGLLVGAIYRLAEWLDGRLTPEQRKEAERFEWRHR